MKTVHYWLTTMIFVTGLATFESPAQTAPPSQDKTANIITRSVPIKYADATQIKSTLDPIAKANGTVITYDWQNRVVILAGTPERVNEMEALISRLDMSPPLTKTIEITGYLLQASDSTIPKGEEGIPPAVEPALKQLRATFNYKSYQHLDTMFLRNRTGPAGATRGAIRLPDYIEPKTGNAIARSAEYTFSYRNSYVTADAKGEVIHLDSVVLQVEGGGSIQSNLDMRPGQLLVIGKTNYGSSSALVTILTAKILD